MSATNLQPHQLFWTRRTPGDVVVTSHNIIWVDERRLSGARDLLDPADDVALFQHVREPTGIAASHVSILDLFLSPRLPGVKHIECLPLPGASNHFILKVNWRCRVLPRPKPHPGFNIWKSHFEGIQFAAVSLP